MPIIFLILLDYPLNSYAEEVEKGVCASHPKTSLDKFKELVISAIGLKKCFDPSASALQKALSCSKPCCIIAGLTSGYVAENSAVDTKVHTVATLCCVSSWNAYAVLLYANRKKTIISKE